MLLTKNQNRDPGIVKFQKTNLYYTDEKYLLYQDPTWLGFKLFFHFDQPDSRLLYAGPSNGNLGTPVIKNTAYSYLTNIGETERAKYLSKFVNHLREINRKTPWFFQTIDGLSEAWKRGYQDEGFKPLLPADRKITIGCLESIDLRMTALMDLYRKACFDWRFRREVVPWNLRTFSVWIYVYEIRNINRSGKPSQSGLLDISNLIGLSDINEKQQRENKRLLGEDPFGDLDGGDTPLGNIKTTATSAFGNLNTVNGIRNSINGINGIINPSDALREDANTINPNISQVLYKFSYCEWLPDESAEVMGKVSSRSGGESEAAQQKISFSYRDVEEVNLYNIYSDQKVVDDLLIPILRESSFDNPTLSEGNFGPFDVNNPKYNKLLPFASLATERLERLIESNIGKLLMGNIYGFSAVNALQTASRVLSGDPQTVLNLADRAVESISNANRNNRGDDLGNIYT